MIINWWFPGQRLALPPDSSFLSYKYYDTPEGVHLVRKYVCLLKYSVPAAIAWGTSEAYFGNYLLNPRFCGNLIGKSVFCAVYGSFVFITLAGIFQHYRPKNDFKNLIIPSIVTGSIPGFTFHRSCYGFAGAFLCLSLSRIFIRKPGEAKYRNY